MSTPVCRFAPSPTGELHVGSLRAALFSFLYARHNAGQFVLRIEDTDLARSDERFTVGILDGLSTCGIDWDGEITYQSANAAIHLDMVENLLASGKAYRDIADSDAVRAWRSDHGQRGYRGTSCSSGAVRLDLSGYDADLDARACWNDLAAGEQGVLIRDMDDPVIARADNTPVFMFANCVDDHMGGITHVVRGNDHMSNTPKQLLILKALGFDAPFYAHLPLITEENGSKKLSKRSVDKWGNPLAVTVESLRTQGIHPHALISYLSRLGWGEGEESFLSLDDLIERFDLSSVVSSSARWDSQKLLAVNAEYLRSLTSEEYAEAFVAWCTEHAPERLLNPRVGLQTAHLVQEKARSWSEAHRMTQFLLTAPVEYDAKGAKKWLKNTDNVLRVLDDFDTLFAGYSVTEISDVDYGKSLFERIADDDVNLVGVLQILRMALSGTPVGPSIYHAIKELGIDECYLRVNFLRAWIKAR